MDQLVLLIVVVVMGAALVAVFDRWGRAARRREKEREQTKLRAIAQELGVSETEAKEVAIDRLYHALVDDN